MHSVSVSDANVCPRDSRSARSCWKFSTMPLWITATVPVQSTCGCALRSVGAPWVAHRVWPIAVVVGRHRLLQEQRLQLRELARPAPDRHPLAGRGDAGGVVSAVLEAPEAFQDDRERLVGPYVADDAAHGGSRVAVRPRDGISRKTGSRRRSRRRAAGPSPRSRPRPSPGSAARCRRAGPAPGRRRRARPPRPRPPPRRPRASVIPSRSATRMFTITCGRRRIAPASSARETPRAAASERNRTAVSSPSPVVACCRKITCPLCSPPSVAPRRSISSRT